jgi:hypothetical protein
LPLRSPTAAFSAPMCRAACASASPSIHSPPVLL